MTTEPDGKTNVKTLNDAEKISKTRVIRNKVQTDGEQKNMNIE